MSPCVRLYRVMRRRVTAPLGLLALVLLPPAARAQTAQVTGVITDSATGARLGAARVLLLVGDQIVAAAETDARGRFRLSGVAPGSYSIQMSRIGFAPSEILAIDVGPGQQSVSARLAEHPLKLDPIVVTANLALETTLQSPSAVTVVPREKLQTTPATTLADHLRDVPGIDFASKGIFSHTFSARGPRSVTSADLLMLSDYRYAAVPVLEFNVPGLIPATTEDLQRSRSLHHRGVGLLSAADHGGEEGDLEQGLRTGQVRGMIARARSSSRSILSSSARRGFSSRRGRPRKRRGRGLEASASAMSRGQRHRAESFQLAGAGRSKRSPERRRAGGGAPGKITGRPDRHAVSRNAHHRSNRTSPSNATLVSTSSRLAS
jgi:hypothetical protein